MDNVISGARLRDFALDSARDCSNRFPHPKKLYISPPSDKYRQKSSVKLASVCLSLSSIYWSFIVSVRLSIAYKLTQSLLCGITIGKVQNESFGCSTSVFSNTTTWFEYSNIKSFN